MRTYFAKCNPCTSFPPPVTSWHSSAAGWQPCAWRRYNFCIVTPDVHVLELRPEVGATLLEPKWVLSRPSASLCPFQSAYHLGRHHGYPYRIPAMTCIAMAHGRA